MARTSSLEHPSADELKPNEKESASTAKQESASVPSGASASPSQGTLSSGEPFPSTQADRLTYLALRLMDESERLRGLKEQIPRDEESLRELVRALVNVRPPRPVDSDFLAVQDAYLQELLPERGYTDSIALLPVRDQTCLWRGDITALRVDAIVNDANPALTGCFTPLHECVDNRVHTYAGVQLRLECSRFIARQGSPEPPGQVKVTGAYNLPCTYVFHTIAPHEDEAAPKRTGAGTGADPNASASLLGSDSGQDAAMQAQLDLLASCYRSCLEEAHARKLASIAFCPLGTGAGGVSSLSAASVAVREVDSFRERTGSAMLVVFAVTEEDDARAYLSQLTGKKL
jgi:O-acetyl-ADP-ribose deacetylase (regulator of RNase III)